MKLRVISLIFIAGLLLCLHACSYPPEGAETADSSTALQGEATPQPTPTQRRAPEQVPPSAPVPTTEPARTEPTPIPTPTATTEDPSEALRDRASAWAGNSGHTEPSSESVLSWINRHEATPTPSATPTEAPTPTPQQQLYPELNDAIDEAFRSDFDPSEGIYTTELAPEYEAMRHHKRNRYPFEPEDMFSDVPITVGIRKEILAHAEYLLDLPYVYSFKRPYWAEASGYSANFMELRMSKDAGVFPFINYAEQERENYPLGPDCTAFVKSVMDYVVGSSLSDYVPTLYDWFKLSPERMKDIDDPTEWLPGDMMIFRDIDTSYRHIAIYYGEGQAIHSVGHKVQISSILDWSMRDRGNLYLVGVYAPPGKIVPEEDAKMPAETWVPETPTPFPTYIPATEPSSTTATDDAAEDRETPTTETATADPTTTEPASKAPTDAPANDH